MSSAVFQATSKENRPTSTAAAGRKRSAPEDGEVFTRGRKQQRTDPLVHYGRHFGRTVRAFCRVHSLLTNGVNRMLQIDLDRTSEEELDASEFAEHQIYRKLLSLVPGLEEKLNTGSNQELLYVADMVRNALLGSLGHADPLFLDHQRFIKRSVRRYKISQGCDRRLDYTPEYSVLNPPLVRNVKTGRGFHHSCTGELLCPVNYDWDDPLVRRDLASGQLVPSGDMWPRFLFRGYRYNSKDPWDGLLRSSLLVLAFKHVFTSPSSAVDGMAPSKSTRSSNARIHGMKQVTIPSIAYIATQVKFALSSTPTFSRNDTVTDSEYFYFLIVDLLEDPEEHKEVDALLAWWNQQIFPVHINHSGTRSLHQDSVIVQIKERRRHLQAAGADSGGSSRDPSASRSDDASTGSPTSES
ncbi:hypothetical protein NMY22_g17512 [Coprinellus aureogranulatus]|nr:hypothetical protein NMY22_g17512 [Coprinellus aureogranulatus]